MSFERCLRLDFFFAVFHWPMYPTPWWHLDHWETQVLGASVSADGQQAGGVGTQRPQPVAPRHLHLHRPHERSKLWQVSIAQHSGRTTWPLFFSFTTKFKSLHFSPPRCWILDETIHNIEWLSFFNFHTCSVSSSECLSSTEVRWLPHVSLLHKYKTLHTTDIAKVVMAHILHL